MTSGWQVVPFAEILTPISNPEPVERDKTYRILGMRWYAQGLFIREDKPGYLIQAKELFRVEKDDFVYNRLFAWKGSFGIVDDSTAGGYVSGEFPCFHVVTKKADPKFIHLYLSRESTWNEIARISSGQTNISRLRLKVQDFLRMNISLPPLDEQRRIVARIEALAARVSEAQRLRREAVEEADTLWQSSSNNAFHIEGNVSSSTLEALCDTIIDNLHTTPKYDGNDFPCIRSQDIGWGSINYLTALRVSSEEFKQRISRGEPRAGDIVFVREGDVGRCALIEDSQRFCLGQRVMMLRPNPKMIEPKYLVYQLMSPRILQEQLLKGMTGTTSKHLNIGKFRKVEFLVPSLIEQHRIIAYLDGLQAQVDALRHLQAESQQELDALLPSILDKAFKGEL